MDLLALLTALRRHKLVVLVVTLLILGADAYIAFGIPPQYESRAQFVLINPPAPPSDAQIERDPRLAKLNTNNPILRLPSLSVVVDVVTQRMYGDDVRRSLVRQGADENYVVEPTNALGSGTVLGITGTGSSPEEASRTLTLVSERMQDELRAMQKVDGADDHYLIQALSINPPTEPVRKVTSTVRSLIGATAAGAVLLFAALSIAEATRTRRAGPVVAVPRTGSVPPAEPTSAPAAGQAPRAPATASNPDNELTMLLPRNRENPNPLRQPKWPQPPVRPDR
ncbi:Capsular polysaccharide biosynthesis protein [Micromonospora viridifaciens]|uniref:Capsular polysaccharide biosynthesis protein n=1 Tax=Micromonospora viridifaciens TaxID=1881 RepID=A0A1C4YYA8_MICVI|nr:Wzz/FepE/Etk N-terminal domain-containing protein [Micromonospora viridifaciens]SCF25617.1 Capsular polysaccharide biosynthesis protein [Micromonospora viridifaciens]